MSSSVPSLVNETDEFDRDIMKISDLKIGIRRPWTIKAVVIYKSSMATSRAGRQIFHVDIKDDSGDIKITAFHEMAKKYFPLLQENSIYYFRDLRIKRRYEKYNKTSHKYELSIENDCIILSEMDVITFRCEDTLIALCRMNEEGNNDRDELAGGSKENEKPQNQNKKEVVDCWQVNKDEEVDELREIVSLNDTDKQVKELIDTKLQNDMSTSSLTTNIDSTRWRSIKLPTTTTTNIDSMKDALVERLLRTEQMKKKKQLSDDLLDNEDEKSLFILQILPSVIAHVVNKEDIFLLFNKDKTKFVICKLEEHHLAIFTELEENNSEHDSKKNKLATTTEANNMETDPKINECTELTDNIPPMLKENVIEISSESDEAERSDQSTTEDIYFTEIAKLQKHIEEECNQEGPNWLLPKQTLQPALHQRRSASKTFSIPIPMHLLSLQQNVF